MIELEVILRILEQVEQEAIEGVKNPASDKRDGFAFGQINGMIYAKARVQVLIEEHLQQEREIGEG